MVKSRIFDNRQLLKEHPEIPHYKEEVVCFMSEYKDRSYPENVVACKEVKEMNFICGIKKLVYNLLSM